VRRDTTLTARGDKKKIENLMDDCDKLFETLAMPVAFIITITWSFFFFLGNIIAANNLTEFTEVFVDFYLMPLALHITVFVSSLLSWSGSVLARRKGIDIRWRRFKTGYQGLARGLKRISLVLLWTSLLLVPIQIICSALAKAMEPKLAFNIYFMITLIVALFLGRGLRFNKKFNSFTDAP